MRTDGKAILINKEVVPCDDIYKWAEWFENADLDRQVARDSVGDVDVSTVFLGVDHSFGGPPLWFETMVFAGKLDQYQERYATYEEAEAGHRRILDQVKNG